tara:strand:- start:703 stop:930 length:228 start_codon:yes stop_codon:yes gene_type:complete
VNKIIQASNQYYYSSEPKAYIEHTMVVLSTGYKFELLIFGTQEPKIENRKPYKSGYKYKGIAAHFKSILGFIGSR